MLRIRRFIYILFVVFKYRLDELILSNIKHPWAHRLLCCFRLGSKPKDSQGKRLRLALESLGPVFVKFGQVLSTRRDLIPAEIANELALLQDRVPPFPSEVAVQTIEKALGASPHVIFKHFDIVPLASASIAQVHAAELQTGEEVAVKVLRPGMREVIDKDLALMRTFANLVHRLLADARRLRPREVVAEFEKYLHDELDLIREAANCSQLRRNFSTTKERSQLLMVPEVYWDYCAKNVFTMQLMKGIPVSQTQRLIEAGVDLKDLARKSFLVRCLVMVFSMRTCTQVTFMYLVILTL